MAPLGLAECRRQLLAGDASPAEILDRCLDGIGAAQTAGAFVVIDAEGARRAAAALPRRPAAPLHGVPVAVKDLIDVAGLPTALGRSGGRTADEDAAVVARLRAAGAIVVGKTRTDELGLGTFTPGARLPWDPGRSPGGSSGGSAIAVAVGAAPLALATDTAGSARIPAAACGVTGLCPSAGWVPHAGVATLSPSCDRIGLIAAGPADIAAAWQALTGRRPAPPPRRVATLAPDALPGVDAERAAAAQAAAQALDPDAAAIPGPSPLEFAQPRGVLITAEAARSHRAGDAEADHVRVQLELGAACTGPAMAAARRRLAALGAELRGAIADRLLVLPTLPSPPPLWSELAGTRELLRATGRLTRLCGPVNTSGLVAISVPWGTDEAGRPIGVQLVGAGESAVIGAALQLDLARRSRANM
jgi:aspartyl-tRNA(Asn)/glutamyl-tRNA(Gln) amidotransferase subunit A